MVADATKPITQFQPGGPAFDASKAKGKTIWYVEYSMSSSATTKIWVNAIKSVVESYGVKFVPFDGKGNQSEINRGMQEAIAAKPGAIYIAGIDPPSISTYLQQAKSAGIPVITSSDGQPGFPTAPGTVADASINFAEQSKMLAAWMVDDSKGNFDAVIIAHSAVAPTPLTNNTLINEVKTLCPTTCHVSTVNVSFNDISTEPAVIQAQIAKSPNLRYVIPQYDWETASDVQTVKSYGGGKVKLLSFNALQSIIKTMTGDSPVVADVGQPNVWYAWTSADQILRVLSGVPPVADEHVPNRLFTQSVVSSLSDLNSDAKWYGDVDYQAEFKKLWSGA